MKLILTGAAGFIGSCYLRKLNSLGICDVLAVDATQERREAPSLQGKLFADYINKDELLRGLETGAVRDYEGIVHLGACTDTTERNRNFLTANNLEFSKSLARWALQNKKFFHYASSASIYGDGKAGYRDNNADLKKYKPLNPYGDSKIQFDRWLVDENLTDQVVGFRYFNVFGPNEYHKGEMRSMVSKAYDQIQTTGKVNLFATTRPGDADGSEERDFIYVKDVNAVMAYFLQHPDKHGLFNVGTGKARTFKDLVLAVFSALGERPRIAYVPMPERLRGQYQYFTQADLTRLRVAGYSQAFMELEDSVKDYVRSHLAQKDPYL